MKIGMEEVKLHLQMTFLNIQDLKEYTHTHTHTPLQLINKIAEYISIEI